MMRSGDQPRAGLPLTPARSGPVEQVDPAHFSLTQPFPFAEYLHQTRSVRSPGACACVRVQQLQQQRKGGTEPADDRSADAGSLSS